MSKKNLPSDQSKSASEDLSHRNGEYFADVLERAMARRSFLKGIGAASAALVVTPALIGPTTARADVTSDSDFADPGDRLTFETVPPGNEVNVVVPAGYDVDVLLRWGDPLTPHAAPLDIEHQTGATQSQQFGFNCDLILWFAMPGFVRRAVSYHGHLPPRAEHGLGIHFPSLQKRYSHWALLAVNHEYTTGADMFPGYDPENPTRDQVEAEIEAHGHSVVELEQVYGQWRFIQHSPFNRRITGTSKIEITGPLHGYDLMRTSDDPDGVIVRGMLNNCAGGRTPWGTVLTCEENFDQYFGNNDRLPDGHPSKALSARIAPEGGETERKWERLDPRFDVSKEPNEYNRFGYVVEIDPYDPKEKPKKRTALGRFKHEGAVPAIAKDGRVAVYSGDDARFEYIYKFVTHRSYNSYDRPSNKQLLDEGTLYTARFDVGERDDDAMGTGEWLPLVWEAGGPLDQAGFANQQEVLLNTRGAADVLGATPMDRPEDVDVHPKSGRVYVTLTNNSQRTPDSEQAEINGRELDTGTDEPNPRGPNPHGHIIELMEDGQDSAALTFRWNIFIKCGDPEVPHHEAKFGEIENPASAGVSPISDPDNIVFDDDGNLWIATDGQFFSDDVGFGQNDGVFAVPVEGAHRGLLRQFLSSVPGAEVCGPEFSGDNRTFFCGIQHPHDGEAFATERKWPVDEKVVSKPSVIAVRHTGGLKIGR
jgi:secreted PhoX family phosphatase